MGTVFFCPPAFNARQKVKPVPIFFLNARKVPFLKDEILAKKG